MMRTHPEAGVELECMGSIPALNADEQSAMAQLARSLLRPHAVSKVGYGTEAGFFENAGVPSIVCGPGSIEQAHKPDEYVDLEPLRQCEDFVDQLVQRLEFKQPA